MAIGACQFINLKRHFIMFFLLILTALLFASSAAASVSFSDLPMDLLFEIVDNPGLTTQDIANFLMTSKRNSKAYDMTHLKKAYTSFGIRDDKPRTVISAYIQVAKADEQRTKEFLNLLKQPRLQRYDSDAFRQPFLRTLLFESIRWNNTALFKHVFRSDDRNEIEILLTYNQLNQNQSVPVFRDIIHETTGVELQIDEELLLNRMKHTQIAFRDLHLREGPAPNCTVFFEIFEELYDTGLVNINDYYNVGQWTENYLFSIHRGVSCDRIDELIQRGADIKQDSYFQIGNEVPNLFRISPLMTAALMNKSDIAAYLVDAGSKISKADQFSWTAHLGILQTRFKHPALKVLLRAKVPPAAFEDAIFKIIYNTIRRKDEHLLLEIIEYLLLTEFECKSKKELARALSESQKKKLDKYMSLFKQFLKENNLPIDEFGSELDWRTF